MKICITTLENNEQTKIDSRFGRAQFFAFVDLETKKIDFVRNPNLEASGGAGIQSAQYAVAQGASVVITGHIGTNAFKVLQESGIEMITGADGLLWDVIKRYETDKR